MHFKQTVKMVLSKLHLQESFTALQTSSVSLWLYHFQNGGFALLADLSTSSSELVKLEYLWFKGHIYHFTFSEIAPFSFVVSAYSTDSVFLHYDFVINSPY